MIRSTTLAAALANARLPRYSPAKFTSATKEVTRGNPNPKHVALTLSLYSSRALLYCSRRWDSFNPYRRIQPPIQMMCSPP